LARVKTAIRRRSTALLGLHPGEGATVGLAMSVAFLASAGIMIAQSAIDALFFARYGVDRLPVLYLLVGIAMFATTFAVGVLFSRVGRGRAFLLVFAGIAAVALVGRLAIETGAEWVYAGLWLVYSVAEFVQLLAVWGLAGLIADTRQAKRFFPVIGAGGVCGLILGGAVTAPLATALGSENLLFVWALLAAGAATSGWLLVHTRAPAALAATRRRGRRRVGGLASAFHDVQHSQLLRWMSVGALLLSLMFSLLYLPFAGAAVERYPDTDDLAGFFGLFFAAGMGTALVLALFVTSRLLGRFGVPTVILLLPILYLIAFGVLAFAATFATLTLFRFAQVAWVSGGSSSAWEALVNTIPSERRDRVRAFLYGVPKQLGTITAGGVALTAQQFDSAQILYAVGGVAAAAAIVVLYRVRVAYPRALIAALREGRPTIFGSPGDPRPVYLHADSTALHVLEELLHEQDPGVRRLAAQALGDLELSGSSASLLRAVDDEDPEVRATALVALHRVAGSEAASAAESRTFDSDPGVRHMAVRVLADCGLSPDVRLLEDHNLAVRALAAALLLGSAERGAAVLQTLARSADTESRQAAMRAIATAPRTEAAPLALNGLSDPEPRVRAEAAKAAAATAREAALEPLVGALSDPDPHVAAAVAEALESIGAPAVDRVAEALLAGHVSGALSALERLPLDGAREQVRRFAEQSVARALGDHRLQAVLPHDGAVLETLRDSLCARAERRAVDALRAAALLGDRAAVSAALDSLQVADTAQRANALEVIETVGEPEIVRPLLTLWEPQHDQRPDAGAIHELLDDPDDWIRACAELASNALEGEPMTHTLPTVPLVERVIFLRRVPLFAELPPQDLQPIATASEEHVFSAGEVIAERGELGDTTYILVEGQVRVVGPRDEEVAVRGPGEVIGEMAVISSRPRVASLVATTDVRVLELHKTAFEAILRERPETALAMMRLLCDLLAPPEEQPPA
jgi:HEAT repeat protein